MAKRTLLGRLRDVIQGAFQPPSQPSRPGGTLLDRFRRVEREAPPPEPRPERESPSLMARLRRAIAEERIEEPKPIKHESLLDRFRRVVAGEPEPPLQKSYRPETIEELDELESEPGTEERQRDGLGNLALIWVMSEPVDSSEFNRHKLRKSFQTQEEAVDYCLDIPVFTTVFENEDGEWQVAVEGSEPEE